MNWHRHYSHYMAIIVSMVAVYLPTLALAQESDGPLEKPLPSYIYDMLYEAGELKISATIDPTRQEGQRILNLSPAMDTLPQQIVEAINHRDQNPEESFWCEGLKKMLPNDRQLLSESADTQTWTFTPVPDQDDKDEQRFMKYIQGKMTIAKKDQEVMAVQLIAPKPFKPAMIAKITDFNLTMECARGPDGRSYVAEMVTHIAGSAAMQKFENLERQTISNLRLPIGE
ncbi:MAG: hypothetical protein ACWA5L_06100 [bacterium]